MTVAAFATRNRTRKIVMRELRGAPPFAADQPVKRPRFWLGLILVLSLILSIGYNAVIPAATAQQRQPDENGHMLYIKKLAHGVIPIFGKPGFGPEAHQPPAYYALCVPVYLATEHLGDAAATRAVRGVSTVLAMLLIVVVYMAVIDLLGDSRLALASASLVAFLPMQVDMSAAVTNDSLINLLFALALWRISRLMIRLDQVKDPSPDARSAIILALLLTAAFWTKSQAVILVPVYIVAFCLMAYRHRASARSTLLVGAVTIVLGLVLATPWLMRNKFLYGDLLATQAFTKEFEQTTPTTKAMLNVCARYLVHVGQATPTDPDIGDKAFKTYFWLDTRWSFASFFGVFDSMSLFWGQDPAVKRPNAFGPMPVIYDIFLALSLVVATGLIVSLVRRKPKLTVGQSSALWIYALMIAGVGYVFVFFNLTFFQAQGRYWFPALLPIAAFAALGLRGLLRKPAPYTVGVILLSAALVALNAYTVWWLLPVRVAAG